MKFILTVFAIGLTLMSHSQGKDRRAQMHLEGRINEISVSPDGKIWLSSAIGNLYFSNDIDSNWHYAKPIFEAKDEIGLGNPRLERISFFNKDTAILTGYIDSDPNKYANNGYYYTSNGGESWELKNFGGDGWMYDAHVHKDGNAWMGGSSGNIYYSSNYGLDWKKLNAPFNQNSRTNSIYMINTKEGIAGALENSIKVTANNWKTTRKIKTPYDQKKYKNVGDYSDNRIHKIRVWGDYLVVNQLGHFFYTLRDQIAWKEFNFQIKDFELDDRTEMLWIVTKDHQVIQLSSPSQVHQKVVQLLDLRPKDIKVVNGSLYAWTAYEKVLKIEGSAAKSTFLYTKDHKIVDPNLIREGDKLTWGIRGREIYLKNLEDTNWWRVHTLDMTVSDFKLKNDSLVVLWDGYSNYTYMLGDKKVSPYTHQFPLDNFLSSPLKHWNINAGTQGCFHSFVNEVNYTREGDSLRVDSASAIENQSEESSAFNNSIGVSELDAILQGINTNPSYWPKLADFDIQEEDIKRYYKRLEGRLEHDESSFSMRKKMDKDFYMAVPSRLSELSDSVVWETLNNKSYSWSTTRTWFNTTITNEKNESLELYGCHYIKSSGWSLPWILHYNGVYFLCYDINFSRFINSSIPESFYDQGLFSNDMLLMNIADYLYWKEP